MVIRPVQARSRKPLHQPAEQALVANVHPQRDLRLSAVAAERRLADQEPGDHTPLELRQLRVGHVRLFHGGEKRETSHGPV